MDYREDRLTLDKYAEKVMEPRQIANGLPLPGPLVYKQPAAR